MNNFADRLLQACEATGSAACVGLDPRVKLLPPDVLKNFDLGDGSEPARGQEDAFRERAAEAFHGFCAEIIRVVSGKVPAVKPQVAFFEQLGVPGMDAYARVVRNARDAGLLVIGDCKRGDIGSTSEAYAAAHLAAGAPFEVDALTVNAYLGSDGVQPFVETAARDGKGLFVLVRTSNPSGAEIQSKQIGCEEEKVYLHVAELAKKWGEKLRGERGYSSVGAVVGATCPEELGELRRRFPAMLFLVPGYGAQGGGASDVAPAFDDGGLGAIVNASRSVIFAFAKSDRADWRDAVADAVDRMNADINGVRGMRLEA